MNKCSEIRDQCNDHALIVKLKELGLTEYKAEKLIRDANEKGLCLQKTYRMTDASILNVDTVLIPILIFFIGSIAAGDINDLPVAMLIFGLPLIVMEVLFRFHKDYWKMLKIYRGLKGL